MSRVTAPSWSLMLKVPVTIILVVVGVAVTIGALVVAQDRARFRTALENKSLLLTRAVAAPAADAVMRGDYWGLNKHLRAITTGMPVGVDVDVVLTAMILDAEGRVLAHLSPEEHPIGMPFAVEGAGEQALLEKSLRAEDETVFDNADADDGFVEGVVPIIADGKRLAVVRVRLSTMELHERTERAGLLVLAVTLGLAAIGSLMGGLISRRMVRPLDELARGMESLAVIDPGEVEPIQVVDRDEIGRVADTFNRVALELAEKKRLEEKLALNEKLAGLGRIAAGVAHEVNNPLGGMLNCINTLRKRPDDAELLTRYLDVLETGLNRISRTVQGLLADLRSETTPSACALSCLGDLRELISAEIGRREIRLNWQEQLEGGCKVSCSCPEIQQIVLNLAMNAIEAMPDGGELSIRLYRQDDRLLVDVVDEGVGIAPEERRRLFDPFYTSRPDGTGLGLWITYRLVERMGGFIEVDSEPGVGSRFRVSLPFVDERGGVSAGLEEVA